jgi:hypothetical protein
MGMAVSLFSSMSTMPEIFGRPLSRIETLRETIEKIISQNSRFSGLPEELEHLGCQKAHRLEVFQNGRCAEKMSQ